MCLKRSGPNKMPPYHRDTTTITFRTSRICDETQTWNELGRDKYIGVWYINAPWQQNISHQMWYSGWVCITCTWLSCQSKPDGLTLADDLHVFNRVSASCVLVCLAWIRRETSCFSSLNYNIQDSINQHCLLYTHEYLQYLQGKKKTHTHKIINPLKPRGHVKIVNHKMPLSNTVFFLH